MVCRASSLAVLLVISALSGCTRQNSKAASSESPASSRRQEKGINEPDNARKSLSAQSVEQYTKARGVLDRARSLRCSFPRGGYVDLADPVLRPHESQSADVVFDAIDRQSGNARIIAKSGAGNVTVISGPTALTFLE